MKLFHESIHIVMLYIQWNLSIKDTSLMRTLPTVPATQSCVQIYLWIRDTSLYRTASWVPEVSTIERFHCTCPPKATHYHWRYVYLTSHVRNTCRMPHSWPIKYCHRSWTACMSSFQSSLYQLFDLTVNMLTSVGAHNQAIKPIYSAACSVHTYVCYKILLS